MMTRRKMLALALAGWLVPSAAVMAESTNSSESVRFGGWNPFIKHKTDKQEDPWLSQPEQSAAKPAKKSLPEQAAPQAEEARDKDHSNNKYKDKHRYRDKDKSPKKRHKHKRTSEKERLYPKPVYW